MPATFTVRSWGKIAAAARDYHREYVAGNDAAADRLRVEVLVMAGADLSAPWNAQHDFVCWLSAMTTADAAKRTESEMRHYLAHYTTGPTQRVRVLHTAEA